MGEKLKELLMQRLGYTPQEAEMLAGDLSRLDPALVPLLERWEAYGTESDAQMFHGFSVDSLRQGSGLNFIAALLTLDWVIREPEKASAAIRQGIK